MVFWKQGYTRGSIIKLEQKRELEYWEKRGMTNKTLKKQLNSKKIRNLSVMDQIKKLVKRKYLVLVIINYGLGFGSIVAGGTLLTQVLYALDYSPVKNHFGPLRADSIGSWSTWQHHRDIRRHDKFSDLRFYINQASQPVCKHIRDNCSVVSV